MIKDENNVDKFMEKLKEILDARIEVGILQSGGVLNIAIIHEYGSAHIPERSFIRGTFDSRKKQIEQEGERLLKEVIEKDLDANRFFQSYGDYLVKQVRDYMHELQSPPNAPSTQKKKGSANPLIYKGKMVESIEWRVAR